MNQNFTCLSFDYQIPEHVFYTSWGVKMLPFAQVAQSHDGAPSEEEKHIDCIGRDTDNTEVLKDQK